MNNTLPVPLRGEILLLKAQIAELRHLLPGWIACLALNDSIYILDCGNCFNAYGVARELRRSTACLQEALERIHIARAFTCYQVVSLLAQTPDCETPLILLDLLATFCDESVRLDERRRLLEESLIHLQRLSVCAPVAASVSTQSVQEAGFWQMLAQNAARVWEMEEPGQPPPAVLF